MERVVELIEKLKGGEIRAEELVEICLERIKELNPKINAFVTLNPRAIEEAKEAKDKPLGGLQPKASLFEAKDNRKAYISVDLSVV